MKCISYAVAEKYDIDNIAKSFRTKGLEPKFYDDVVHISPHESPEHKQDIFIFPYGCIVAWGVSEDYISWVFDVTSEFAITKYDDIFEEITYYEIAESPEIRTHIVEEDDTIVLSEDDELIKLSFSHALSQSVKLDVFEMRVNKAIEHTRPLCHELSTKGYVSLSRKKLAQQIGLLFAERNSINLDNDILDMPEFFWRRPRYETYYQMASNYMDINTRLDILNRRLDAIHELYDILSNELNHIHSSRLEMVIIILIVIEVIMTILRDLLKWI